MATRLEGIEAQIWASAYGAGYVIRTVQGIPSHTSSLQAIELANEAVLQYQAISEAAAMVESAKPPAPKRRWLFW